MSLSPVVAALREAESAAICSFDTTLQLSSFNRTWGIVACILGQCSLKFGGIHLD